MMKFRFSPPLLMVLCAFFANGQTDEKAKSFLDQLSAKTKNYKTIKADFTYTLENKAEDINETQTGSISIKDNKYILIIAGQEVRCDGKTIWTYLKDAGEVQITEVEEEKEGSITVTSIFTVYEKGFRHEYKKDESINGVMTAIIQIYPLKLDEKSYHTVRLFVDKNKMEINKIVVLGKEGDVYTYRIKSFLTNIEISDGEFVFQKSKYPNAEVIDLR